MEKPRSKTLSAFWQFPNIWEENIKSEGKSRNFRTINVSFFAIGKTSFFLVLRQELPKAPPIVKLLEISLLLV